MVKFGFAKKITFENLEEWLGHRVLRVDRSLLLLGLGILAYTVSFSFFTIVKHYEFGTRAWDLGIFNQSYWTTLHEGKLFYSTVELLINPSGSFFATHFSPILFLVLPAYAVYPAPQSLLVTQSFILALGAVPLYKLAVRVTKYRIFALSLANIYLLYPPLQGINWFDFHAQSFLPLFFLSAFYFFEKRSWKPYFLFVILSLMCEEHAAVTVVSIGLFAILQHRKHLLAAVKTRNFKDSLLMVSLLTMASGILWYTLTILVRNVFFSVNPAFLSTFKAASNWRILGVEDPTMIPLYILQYPSKAMAALGYDIHLKVSYLLALFAPLAFTSFHRMKYLLPTVPWFVYSFFSNYQPYYLISFQYSAYVVAFIFIAATYAIGYEVTDLRRSKKRVTTALMFGVMAFLLVSPLSLTVAILLPDYGVRPISGRDELIHQLLTYVPSNASIMADSTLFPHVSSRSNAYVVPSIQPIWTGHISECKNFTNSVLGEIDYVIVDTKAEPFASSIVFSLIKDHAYGVLASADGAILFKRNYSGKTIMLSPYYVRYDYNRLSLFAGELIQFPNSSSSLVAHFNETFGHSLMFWYGPSDPLPSGNYNIIMRLRVNGSGELFRVDLCTDGWQQVLFSKNFSSTDFVQQPDWINQTLPLSVTQPLPDFELRTIYGSGKADIYLDYIEVKQISP
jgi:uncharacterized membrane protein